MPKRAKPLPVITDEQRAIIEKHWDDQPDVLLQRVFPDKPDLDQRSIEWRSIRSVLATIGKAPEASPGSSTLPRPAQKPDQLSPSQEEFLRASYKDASGPVELARTLWADERIMSNDPRVQMVLRFVRKIDQTYRREDEPVDEMDYQPPRTTAILVGRLNRYGIGARPDGKSLGDGGLSNQEKRALEVLLTNMRRSVFKVEADKFTKKIDRDVFEETFIGTTWGKLDLSHEHVMQYLVLASLSAQRNATDRMMRTLDERFLLSLEDAGKPLSKSEVDALKETKNAAAEHLKQINTLIKTLEGERSKIAAAQREGTASMHPLVAAWKEQESRHKLIQLAQRKQQAALKQEVERFATMDSLRAEIWGLDPDTIIH